MAQFRYVGGAQAEIWDSPFVFKAYGQLVEMPDDVAQKAMEGRIALVPAKEFDSLGHTQDELKKFSRFESHRLATPEFLTKRAEAWKLAQAHHSMATDLPPAEPKVVEPEPQA